MDLTNRALAPTALETAAPPNRIRDAIEPHQTEDSRAVAPDHCHPRSAQSTPLRRQQRVGERSKGLRRLCLGMQLKLPGGRLKFLNPNRRPCERSLESHVRCSLALGWQSPPPVPDDRLQIGGTRAASRQIPESHHRKSGREHLEPPPV